MGLIANTATILGLTLGQRVEGITGPDVYDASGHRHPGITTMPLPVLRGTPAVIDALMDRLREATFSDLLVVDFSDVAQRNATYQAYNEDMGKARAIRYLGLAIYGSGRKVNKLTGSIPLLR